MQRDIEEPCITNGMDLGNSSYGLCLELAVANDPQAPGTLGDEHVAARQEHDAPGVR